MTVGNKIQECRKKYGITQRELAERCGLATGTIQQYESGKRTPKIENLAKIANAFNIYLPALLSECEDRYEIAAAIGDQDLLESLRLLDDLQIIDNVKDILNRTSPHAITPEVAKKNYQQLIDSKRKNSIVQEETENTIEEKNAQKTDTLLKNYQLLNDSGQDRAIEQVEMLTKIPEYRKDTE